MWIGVAISTVNKDQQEGKPQNIKQPFVHGSTPDHQFPVIFVALLQATKIFYKHRFSFADVDDIWDLQQGGQVVLNMRLFAVFSFGFTSVFAMRGTIPPHKVNPGAQICTYVGENETSRAAEYSKWFMEKPAEERARIFLPSQPIHRDEILDAVYNEVLLFQRTTTERMLALKEISKNKKSHLDVQAHLSHHGIEVWHLYSVSMLEYRYCNLLKRWIGYLSRHPEAQDLYDRFFEMAFLGMVGQTQAGASGFSEVLNGLEPYSMDRVQVVIRGRDLIMDAVPHTVAWFRDPTTPVLAFFGRTYFLLRPLVSDAKRDIAYLESKIIPKKHWPSEYDKTAEKADFTINFKCRPRVRGGEPSQPTVRLVDSVWEIIEKLPEYKCLMDITGEFDEQIFLSSFIVPIPKTVPERQPKPITKPKAKTPPKGQKKKARTPKPSSPAKQIVETVADTKPNEETKDAISTANAEKSLPDANATAGNQIQDISRTPVPDVDVVIEDEATFSSDSEQDWQDMWAAEQARIDSFNMTAKKTREDKRLIKQSAEEKSKGATRSKLKALVLGMPSTARAVDTTELCLAFPAAHELFIQNANISQSKAKRFKWFFDQTRVIKAKHMDFLCHLFGLSNKGKLTYKLLKQTYWALEGSHPAREERKMVSRKGIFDWSYRFEIDGVLVTPLPNDVHPEHASSRFSHIDALDLFSRAGFDPRFFIEVE